MGLKRFVDNLYCSLFARQIFYPIHKLFLQLSVKGMGLNINGGILKTGEEVVLSNLAKKIDKEKEIVVFDIGANVGNYSKLIIRYLPNAKIYAFEPLSKNVKVYNRLHSLNKNIELIQVGLGEKNCKGTIYCPKFKGPSALASVQDIFGENKDLDSEEIEMVTIDDFCKKRGIKEIDFAKLDIEGNELVALKGAKRMINEGKIKIIQFEFNFLNIYCKVSMEDFRKLLKSYNLYRVLPNGLLKMDFSKKIYSEIYGYQNILALKKDKVKNAND